MAFKLYSRRSILTLTEEQEQILFCDWLDLMQIPYFHVPNGGYRTASEGARLKRMGTKPGVPDICIPRARSGYNGAYVEMKRIGGVVSKVQREWLDRLKFEGYYARAAYGGAEAISIIKTYISC